MSKEKSRILDVKRFLYDQTDETHHAVLSEIIAYLDGEGIAATRKTVAHDIEQLIEAGMDIVCNKSRQNQYFVGDRHFEIPELKLLVDAAQASRFLSAKRSKMLINKLLALSSTHQSQDLASGLYYDDCVKPKNENTYINTDVLLNAISAKKRVKFMYYEYGTDKKRTYKHGRRQYEISPWTFIWNNDGYYIIGPSESHGKIATFRVDRIAAPKLSELDSIPKPESFDIAEYMKSVYQMYDGPMIDVELICEKAMMDVIIDRFGESVYTEVVGEEHFRANVNVSASKTFYGWVFSTDGMIQIAAPVEAVETYRRMLKQAGT